jgi:hypothetical protein
MVPTNFPHQISKSKVPKTTQRNHQERAPEITTKNNREQHIKTLTNHAESSIHATKVLTRSSLSPDHPTFSQDLTMKLSSWSYRNPKKIGRENKKANELGFQESWLPSSHLLGYMEATESLKYPFLTTTDTSPSRAVLEVFTLSPSGGCPATATCLASTQALRSRRVSSASKIPDYVVSHRSDQCSSPVRPVPTGQTSQTHRSDRSGTTAAPSSVLRSWLCGSTKEPSGFLVNHQKPRELGVASANLYS